MRKILIDILLHPLKILALFILIFFTPLFFLFETQPISRLWLKELWELILRQTKWMLIVVLMTFLVILVGGEEVLLLCSVVIPLWILIIFHNANNVEKVEDANNQIEQL